MTCNFRLPGGSATLPLSGFRPLPTLHDPAVAWQGRLTVEPGGSALTGNLIRNSSGNPGVAAPGGIHNVHTTPSLTNPFDLKLVW